MDEVGLIKKNANDIASRQIREAIQSISQMGLVYLPNETVPMEVLLEENSEYRKTIGEFDLEKLL